MCPARDEGGKRGGSRMSNEKPKEEEERSAWIRNIRVVFVVAHSFILSFSVVT